MNANTVRLLLVAAGLALPAAPAGADNAANKARSTLSDCLKALPADKLNDNDAIAECLGRAQGAAEAEDKRKGQIEFQRRLDDMDRLIERTTRGSRRP